MTQLRHRGHGRAPAAQLPVWQHVLVVVAHPDDESFGLGAVIGSFVDAGARVVVLCLTHGEASTLHGCPGDLHDLRATELQAAGRALGATATTLRDHQDGGLAAACRTRLVADVLEAVRAAGADGLLVFDVSGVTGHSDHAVASSVAVEAADLLRLPVLAWTLPAYVADALNAEFGADFTGHPVDEVDVALDVDRSRQAAAIAAHASQAVPGSVLWRRLELLGPHEYLRWLRAPQGNSASRSGVG